MPVGGRPITSRPNSFEMADGLQALEQAFDLGFVFGTEKAVSSAMASAALLGGKGFAQNCL